MKVEFYRHGLGAEEYESLRETLESVFLTTGRKTARFEEEFAACLGVPHVVGVTSCTVGMHLALMALGIGPGDEVIAPAITFVASINPVFWLGAHPVLADVRPDDALIDVADVARKITHRTKAVIAVNLYGAMADMKALEALCRPRDIFIVEDSAHCVEGKRDGIGPGQISDAACFSFYATKNLTCGEGGAVALRNRELAERVTVLRQHGITRNAADRYGSSYQHWDMTEMGYKYNMFDVQAALLLPQFKKLAGNLRRRVEIWQRYDEAFHGLPDVSRPVIPANCVSGRHIYTIWVPRERRDGILQELSARGVGCAVNYRAVHTLTYYARELGLKPEDLPTAYDIGERTVTLPLYPALTEAEIDHVIRGVNSTVAGDRA